VSHNCRRLMIMTAQVLKVKCTKTNKWPQLRQEEMFDCLIGILYRHNSRKLVFYSEKIWHTLTPLPDTYIHIRARVYVMLSWLYPKQVYWNIQPSLRQPFSQHASWLCLMLFDEPRELLTHCYRSSVRLWMY